MLSCECVCVCVCVFPIEIRQRALGRGVGRSGEEKGEQRLGMHGMHSCLRRGLAQPIGAPERQRTSILQRFRNHPKVSVSLQPLEHIITFLSKSPAGHATVHLP